MNNYSSKLSAVYLFLFLNIFTYADISFVSAGINKNNDILFSVKTSTAESYSYETLFMYSPHTDKTEQLTFFPEKLESLDNGKILQIVNRYGIARITSNVVKKELEFNPFNSAGGARLGILKSLQTSNNGKWITFIEPYSAVHGKLILYDIQREFSYILSEKIPRDSAPVSWSPDSNYFLYEEDSEIYFARPEWFTGNSLTDKKYRKLGAGSVKNIVWISASSFAYFINGAVYKISAPELFARSFYGGLLNYGKLIGKIPIYFDSAFDDIFISSDSSAVIFVHNKRNVYFFGFSNSSLDKRIASANSMPYLLLPESTVETKIQWRQNGVPVIFSSILSNGEISLKAWEMNAAGMNFKKVNLPENAKLLAVDENFTKIALKEKDVVSFYDTRSWKKLNTFTGDNIVSAAWKDSETIFLGGYDSVIEYPIGEKKSLQKVLLVSSVKAFSGNKSGENILAETHFKRNTILKHAEGLKWILSDEEKLSTLNTGNSSYRIYIDSTNGYFSNMIFIRTLSSSETKPLFYEPKYSYSITEKNINTYKNPAIFSNGSRTGKKQAAIVFDVMDNMDGITQILYTLKQHGISATFFINGEAINQNPEAVREIVKNGHQCGSLFFTTWNFSASDYSIDGSFIKKGLARNEDLFFSATQTEFSLIWHSPFYISSPMIINAGKAAGYTFVAPDITIPDWINSKDKYSVPSLYKNSDELINDILSSIQAGSIIPIRIGKIDSSRMDYLYMRLELLINAVKENGFSIVSIAELMQK